MECCFIGNHATSYFYINNISPYYCSLSQRDRLRAELEYMEKLRGIKRRREVLPHRAQLDLLMGGKRVDLTERYVVQHQLGRTF